MRSETHDHCIKIETFMQGIECSTAQKIVIRILSGLLIKKKLTYTIMQLHNTLNHLTSLHKNQALKKKINLATKKIKLIKTNDIVIKKRQKK